MPADTDLVLISGAIENWDNIDPIQGIRMESDMRTGPKQTGKTGPRLIARNNHTRSALIIWVALSLFPSLIARRGLSRYCC